MLEDILYLVAFNGFAKDIGPAVATCKAIMTDERIWFPHLIQQTYGPKNKTRLQIMVEHMTSLKNGDKQHVVMKKNKLIVYMSEDRFLERLTELDLMAKEAKQSKLLHTMLGIPDSSGTRIISVACQNNCPKIVRELIKRGVWFNQKDDSGATPCYYGFNSKFGRDAWKALPYCAEYEYPKPKPSWRDNLDINEIINIINNQNVPPIPEHAWNIHHDLLIDGQGIELIANTQVPLKPKKLKSKLYKQQFGPKK